MKVEFEKPHLGYYKPGDQADFDDGVAKALIKSGKAKLVRLEESKTKLAQFKDKMARQKDK